MNDGNSATTQVVRSLNEAGIDYMLVGSYASNYWGVPRATQDADFVILLKDRSLDDLLHRLGPGFTLDPQLSFESVTGTYRYIIEVPAVPFRIDLFLLSSDNHDQTRFRRKRAVFDESLNLEVNVASAEDVIVTKLRWSMIGKRDKDLDDARTVAGVVKEQLDWDYLEHWTEKHGTRQLLDQIREDIADL